MVTSLIADGKESGNWRKMVWQYVLVWLVAQPAALHTQCHISTHSTTAYHSCKNQSYGHSTILWCTEAPHSMIRVKWPKHAMNMSHSHLSCAGNSPRMGYKRSR